MASKDSNGDDVNDKPDSSEDNFGLPDIEYKPLDQPAEPAPAQETTSKEGLSYASIESEASKTSESYSDSMEEEPKSKAPIILGVVIILVLLIAGYLIYNFVYKPKAAAEKAKQEQLVKDAALKKKQEEEARVAKQKADEEKRIQELANAKPVFGTIETLSSRTKRYYVVVTSDIDDDLLMDFAKRLSVKGINTKIIPPFGDKQFYRLAIADHDTYALAQANADAAKADYGGGVWVMRY